MTDAAIRFNPQIAESLPDHTQLPDSDGTFVKNFQEHPQSMLLTSSIRPVLKQLHPDGNYAIGQDSGIYWRLTEPLERGAEAPDWFYVPNVPPLLNGKIRRSYVLWKETVTPLIALEFASGNGSEERDRTPLVQTDIGEVTKPGKFWVYENAIGIPYYGIYEIAVGRLEVYHLVDGVYQPVTPNKHGRFLIPPLGVELGVWEGEYLEQLQKWLRWWDLEGQLLPSAEQKVDELASENSELASENNELASENSELAAENSRLMEKLRSLGIDPSDL